MTTEQIIGAAIAGAALAPMAGIGVAMLCGKGANLIAGYNTMSKERKSQYDEKALCRFAGIVLLCLFAFMTGFVVGAVLGINVLMIVCGALVAVTVVFTLIFANSKRFKRKSE